MIAARRGFASDPLLNRLRAHARKAREFGLVAAVFRVQQRRKARRQAHCSQFLHGPTMLTPRLQGITSFVLNLRHSAPGQAVCRTEYQHSFHSLYRTCSGLFHRVFHGFSHRFSSLIQRLSTRFARFAHSQFRLFPQLYPRKSGRGSPRPDRHALLLALFFFLVLLRFGRVCLRLRLRFWRSLLFWRARLGLLLRFRRRLLLRWPRFRFWLGPGLGLLLRRPS